MAKPPDFPIVELSIAEKDFHDDTLKLIDRIKPNWEAKDIVSKSFTEGLSNTTRCFHLASDTELQDGIMVRLHGDKLGGLVERNREFMAMQIGAAAGCFTHILAVFSNGIAYQYAPGRTLTGADLVDPKVITAVATKLAQLHMVDMDTISLVDLEGKVCRFDMSEAMEEKLRQMATHVPDSLQDAEKNVIYQKHKISKEEAVDGVDQVFKIFKDISARTCINHGDFQPKNILYDEKTGTATFVDYELTEVRYEVMDLNTIFVTRPMWELVGILKPDDPEITHEVRSLWIRRYMERKYELMGKDPKSIPDLVLEKSGVEQELFAVAAYLTMLLYSMTFAGVPNFPVPMISLLPIMSEKWAKEKDQLPELKERLLRLQNECADL